MKRLPSNIRFSVALRVLAAATAGLVLALSVLTVCPELHAWLHAHEPAAASRLHAEAGTQDGRHGPPAAPDRGDGCAVVMFAQGVLDVVLWAVLGTVAWRTVGLARHFESSLDLSRPRYWLPPLCGPPLG